MRVTPGLKLPVLFTLLSIFWASEFVAIKLGLSTNPPLIFAGSRYFLAGVVLLLLVVVRGKSSLNLRELLIPVFLGVFAMMEFGFLHFGMQYVGVGAASILFNTQPIMVTVLATIVLKESFTWKKAVANVGGFLGVVLIFVELLDGLASLGGFLILLGAFSYSVFSVLFKKLIGTEDLLFVSSIVLLTCGAFLLTGSAIFQTFSLVITPQVALIITYLAIVSSALGFVVYFHLLKHYDVSQVSPYQFLIPVFAIFLGWLLLGERVHLNEVIGISCIGLSIYILNK